MKKFCRYILLITGVIFLLAITGCGGEETKKKTPAKPKPTEAVSKTEKVLAVVNYIDLENRNLSFKNVDTGAEEFYAYTNGTEFLSRNDVAMAAAQIKTGDVIDLYYDSTSLIITKMQLSKNKDVWENGRVTSFSVDENTNSMKIGKTMYFYTEGVGVYSEGEEIDIMELNNSMDLLDVKGYKNQVVSIVVDKGHGYVSLSGDTLFIGGLVSISGILARKIEPDMLLPVTEGEYLLEVVNGDYKAEKQIKVERGRETIVDFSDIPANVVKTGNVKFIIDVEEAELTIDGTAYNYSKILTLKTGTHKVVAKASGYKDYTMEIDVKAEYQVINISMKKGENETSSGKEEETTKPEQPTVVEGETYVSKINDVTVLGPKGGLVYFDGTYKGVAPVTFDMVTGAHVISILYNKQINSYSVNLSEGADDVTYDFTDK